MPDQLTKCPLFHMAFKEQIHLLVFRLLAKTSQDETEGLVVVVFCCDLRLENGTLRYIHSQCSFLPSPSVPYTTAQADCRPWSGQIYTGTKVKRPPRTGFLKCLQSQTVWIHTHPARLAHYNILLLGLDRNN